MSKQLRKEFEKQYGVTLLPRSFDDLKVGEIVNIKGLFTQMIDFKMYTIADLFDLPEEKIKEINDRLRSLPLVKANFPEMEIRSDFSSDTDLEIPGFNFDISAMVEKSKVRFFKFGNIKAKRLTGGLRRKIDDEIEKLESKDPEKYRKEIKNSLIIEALYYSDTLEVGLDKDVNVDFQADTGNLIDLNVFKVDHKMVNQKEHSYIISGCYCPFAAELVKGKNF